MDRVGEWRLIEPDDEDQSPERQPGTAASGASRRMAMVVGLAVMAALALAIWATLPQGGVALDVSGEAGSDAEFAGPDATQPSGDDAVPETARPPLVVDVQGAVVRPGVHTLPAGGRVGDAIAAAGGYSAQVDIARAAERLNLAEPLTDGAKIHVPLLGDAATEWPSATLGYGASADPAPPGVGGPIDINTASATELETLPGIGPVTAQKIIGLREAAPFASVEDLLARGALGPATFEKVRELVTVSR